MTDPKPPDPATTAYDELMARVRRPPDQDIIDTASRLVSVGLGDEFTARYGDGLRDMIATALQAERDRWVARAIELVTERQPVIVIEPHEQLAKALARIAELEARVDELDAQAESDLYAALEANEIASMRED